MGTEQKVIAKDVIIEELDVEVVENQNTEAPEEPKKWSLQSKIIGLVISLVVAGSIGFAAYILLSGGRTISTGNATVRTDLVHVIATIPGELERFDVYEGMHVEAGQIIGWVRYGETFRSPIDGIIVGTHVLPGQHLLPMEPVATIACLSGLHVQANIYESDIQDIRLGQPVAVTLDGVRGQTFNGYVRHIGRITDLELVGGAIMVQTGTFRRVVQTIPIEVAIPYGVDLSLFLGTNARVSLPVLSGDEELVYVPQNNVQTNQITATGSVESITARNIYPLHNLRIDEVLVRIGDFVEEGQPLATLDVTDLETAITTHRVAIEQMTTHNRIQTQETQRMLDTALRNINNNTNIHMVEAQANLTASRIQLEDAQRIYNQVMGDYESRTDHHVVAAESFLRTATLELERLTSEYADLTIVYEAGAIARHDIQQMRDAVTFARNQYNDAVIGYQNATEAERRTLENVRSALNSATIAYEIAADMVRSVEIATRQEVEALQAGLEMTQIDEIEQMRHYLAQMERHLEEGVITAPISGTVTAVHAEPGEFSMFRLFTIETLDELRVLANVREYDLPRIYIGQPVTLTAYATGEQIHTGVITSISPRAVMISPIVLFEIEVTITSEYSLLPGMSARIRIDID